MSGLERTISLVPFFCGDSDLSSERQLVTPRRVRERFLDLDSMATIRGFSHFAMVYVCPTWGELPLINLNGRNDSSTVNLLVLTLAAAGVLADDQPLELPGVGDHQLRIIAPDTLELT